jgi:hypothetical protein
MIRLCLIALVTIVGVSLATLPEPLAAQANAGAAQQPVSFPLEFVGGTPGVSIEVYLNAGKVGDTTLNSTGGGNWLLDMGNSGKTRVTIYVDVCQDGKIVKVLFVTGGGAAPPEADDCDRRLAAVSFESDCGVTRITLNFRTFGANVLGCGGISFKDPKVIGGVGGGVVLLALLAGGSDDGPSGLTNTPPVFQAPPLANTSAPPVANPPPVAAPTAPQASIPVAFAFHPQNSNTSVICGVASIQPPTPGTTFTFAASGPGVLPNQNVSGTFNSNGQAAFSIGIASTGAYSLTLTIRTTAGATATAATNVNVTSANVPQCPSVPS